MAGRVNYNWAYRYFIDFNFGYNGSENFHKDYRFGFFPAISGAWNIAEEPFLKKAKWINMLKVRYSYGKTGNDKLQENGNDIRFPYLATIETMKNDGNDTGGYYFNDYAASNNYIGGMRYTDVASVMSHGKLQSNRTWVSTSLSLMTN